MCGIHILKLIFLGVILIDLKLEKKREIKRINKRKREREKRNKDGKKKKKRRSDGEKEVGCVGLRTSFSVLRFEELPYFR